MKTSERRAKADNAFKHIDQLETEIRAQMATHNMQSDLDNHYADFKAYSTLRNLHEQYADWKQQYTDYADHPDLVDFVGQSEHDILRENYPRINADTRIVPITTDEKVYFYRRDAGPESNDKIQYEVVFEKIKILPFHTCYMKGINSLFIRVNHAGQPS